MSKILDKWRRSEGHSLPMTEDGVKRAEERYKGFEAGFEAGYKAALTELISLHSITKKHHSFFYQATEYLKDQYTKFTIKETK